MTATRWRSGAGLALVAVTLAGFVLRSLPAIVHDWPIRDGGLFWQMTADLLTGGLALPGTTTYNGGEIPFAYPPLSFYLVAVLESMSLLDRASLFRILPAVFATLAIPAVAGVASVVLPTARHAVAAAAFYALIPGSYEIHITGGGLPRSLGFLFALLAVWAGLVALRRGRVSYAFACGVLGGLAAMTHPQSPVFVAVAIAVALVVRPSRRSFALVLGAALVAVVAASPWWATVVAQHGLEPFRAALGSSRRDTLSSIVAYAFLTLVSAPVVGVFDILGQARELLRHRFGLVGWRAGVFAVDLRYSPISGAVPIAMLASVGLIDGGGAVATALRTRLPERPANALLAFGLGALVIAAAVPAVTLTAGLAGPSGAMSAADRDAMTSLANTTPTGTAFLVLSGGRWGSDDVAEWFPALSSRVSVDTGQGLEWTGGTNDHLAAESELEHCSRSNLACVESWLASYAGEESVGLYLTASASSSGACCPGVADAVRASSRYSIIRDDDAALVALPVAGSTSP